MTDVLPDPQTSFGARVRRRLQEDRLIWVTSVSAAGVPQPRPVWFWWDGETVLVYNRPDAMRVAHVRRSPHVSLNFDGDGKGGDIIVVIGNAEFTSDDPPAHQHPGYSVKYAESMPRVSGSAENYSKDYPVAFRITPLRVLGH